MVQAGPGAEIVRGNELLAYITPPRTLDAQGQEVPSSLRVTGGRVELSIEHRSADVAYPLLVDPWVAENYGSWYNQENTGVLDGYGRRWFSDRPPDWFFKDEPREWWAPSTWCNGGLGGCYGGSGRGLIMYAYPGGGGYPADTFGEWIYTIPGYNFDNPGSEPTTYIAMFDFQQQGMNCRGDYSGSPLLLNGIYSPVGGNWTALLGHGCGNPNAGGGGGGVGGGVDEGGGPDTGDDPSSGSFLFSSAVGAGYNGVRPKEEGKIAAFAAELQSGGVRSQWLDAYMGGAIAYLDDPEIPTPDPLVHSVSPNQWTQGNETRTVVGSATDPGLGVKWFNLERRGADGQFSYLTQAQHPCTATRQSRCPRTWAATLGYSTSSLPEGITDYKLRAFDPGYADNNESSQQTWPVKIDRTAPTLAVSGELWNARSGKLGSPVGDLFIDTTDGIDNGNPADARSGVRSIEIQVDGQRAEYDEQDCTQNCEVNIDWNYRSSDFTAGTHRITVIATDQAGNQRSTFWDVQSEPVIGGDETEKIDPEDDGSAPDLGDGISDFCTTDPDAPDDYCTNRLQPNPLDLQVASELPIDPTAPVDPPPNDPSAPPATAASVAPDLLPGSDGWAMSNQRKTDFDEPLFQTLFPAPTPPRKKRIRLIIPWDTYPRAQGDIDYFVLEPDGSSTKKLTLPQDTDTLQLVEEYVDKAQAPQNGFEVLISFERTVGTANQKETYTDAASGKPRRRRIEAGPRVLPTVDQYEAATTAFRNHFSTRFTPIRFFTAWNEPNNKAQPTSGRRSYVSTATGARFAGKYWRRLKNRCGTACTVAAGDFEDSPRLTPEYMQNYIVGAGAKPAAAWAFHAYYTGLEQNSARFRTFLKATKSKSGPDPPIWLTEQGPMYHKPKLNYDQTRGDAVLQYLLRVPSISSRITRFYYYSWTGNPGFLSNGQRDPGSFDSGLIDPLSNQPRIGFCTYRKRINPNYPYPDSVCPRP